MMRQPTKLNRPTTFLSHQQNNGDDSELSSRREHWLIHISYANIEVVATFNLLSVNITENLSWNLHMDITDRKARQCSYFLRTLSFTRHYLLNLPQKHDRQPGDRLYDSFGMEVAC